MPHICGERDLDAFRASWTGDRLLSLLHEHGGKMFVPWQIGVGKSQALDATTEAAVRKGNYDLVIALFPLRRVLEERRWVRNPPADVRIVNLRPRPPKRCGSLDGPWLHHEKVGLSALGRQVLCGKCSRRKGCDWPRQYGRGLRNARVIYATQAHFGRAPNFITQLANWTGAERVLTLLDEGNFFLTSFRREISRSDLERFASVLRRLKWMHFSKANSDWSYRVELLLAAPTHDLRFPEWKMPYFSQQWAIRVQRLGWETYREKFRFLAYDLRAFGFSPLESRERLDNGDVVFAAPPLIRTDCIIFSGTAHPEFARFRLGQDLANPFAEHEFSHPGTRWYNISSRIGMRAYFAHNVDQVLDFFAGLIQMRIQEGRRPLLVAKKCFLDLCADGLTRRLKELGLPGTRIVINDWEAADLEAPHTLPLINFGMVGTNRFEHLDCAYCITGFYINENTLNTILQDVLASDGQIPLKITTAGVPRRRKAGVLLPRHRYCDIHRLAQMALDQQEMDVVLQGVGRVRPYTRGREVITFQCAAHPQLEYTAEFSNLEEARVFFGVPSRRQRLQRETVTRIREAKCRGMTQAKTAEKLGCSVTTVKRYWNTPLEECSGAQQHSSVVTSEKHAAAAAQGEGIMSPLENNKRGRGTNGR